MVQLAHRVNKVFKVLLDLQVLKVCKDQLVILDQQAHKAFKALQDPLAPLAHKAMLDLLAHKAYRVFQARQARLAHKVILALPVLLAQLVQAVTAI